MSVRFVHTADWQLGKPFAGVDEPAKRAALQAERFAVLPRIAELATRERAAFILVAGDVFDSPTPTKSIVSQACAALGRMPCPVVIIPGNHDHGGVGSVWTQPYFSDEAAALAPNLRVLLEPTPLILDAAVVLPCPLQRRHEATDTTAWLRQLPNLPPEAASRPRIVLAHGSIQSFGGTATPEDDDGGAGVNLLDLTRLPAGEYDYLALGDWHGTKQISPHAWYSGTPEPDRFPKGDAQSPGNVLLVEAARGAAPNVVIQPTGRIGWHDLEFTFRDDAGVEQLAAELQGRLGARTQADVLRLTLRGALGLAGMSALERLREQQEARLLRVKWEASVLVAPTAAESLALTQRLEDPLIARVATRLVERMQSATPEEASTARIALRALHLAVTPAA